MLDKSNKVLGQDVKAHLESLGINTPTIEQTLSKQEQVEALTELYQRQHEILGLDLRDDSLIETPLRVAKLQVYESMKGLDFDNFPKMTTVENKFYDGMVSINDIRLISLCEHHHERIVGFVNIAYIPERGGRVMGLSKAARVVDFFGSQPIIQERFSSQVFETLKFVLGTEDVAVSVRSMHMCMFARGVKEPCSNTVTNLLGGRFKTDDAMRSEYMSQIDFTKPLI